MSVRHRATLAMMIMAVQAKAAKAREAAEERPQPAVTGSGPLYNRRYWVNFTAPHHTPDTLAERVKQDFAKFSPSLLADFEKRDGSPWVMREGDKYDIRIFGPWNGSVRVAEVTPTSFTLETLQGHPEAGTIRFSVKPFGAGMRFEIESWARSRDGLVQLTYDGLKIGQWVQAQVWVTFCKRVVEESGGKQIGRVRVQTRTIEPKKG